MKIALVHYHLKTGGVTTVLKQQIAALHNTCELIVLTGDRADCELPCQINEIPGLGYDRTGAPPVDPDRVADSMLTTLRRKWPDGCDILHIHNPLLAKNRHMLQIIERLRQVGIKLFLQIHDFAEDGRPEAFFKEAYPADCHYGVLNQRDADILTTAGLENAGLHLIPNAVASPPIEETGRQRGHVLYPVRAIRRKNLGEAILLTLFEGKNRRLIVTQPPNSPMDWASYGDWVAWVDENRWPVEFEGGKKNDFASLLKEAAFVITTSVAEGFGLVFLEPWTVGRLLWGRRIGDICKDFERRGVRLDFLYERLDVPLAWIDGRSLADRWHQAACNAAERFGYRVSAAIIRQAFSRLTAHGKVDFGVLSERFQRQVLDRVVSDPTAKSELVRMNPWLAHPGKIPEETALVESNRRAVMRHYSGHRYRQRLLAVYDRVISHRVTHRIDKRVLFNAFFDLDRFSLLRWAPYDG